MSESTHRNEIPAVHASRNARFAQGGNAFFEGKVKGSPTPRIVWTRKGMEMKESSKHQNLIQSLRKLCHCRLPS